jgi:hypothetical protein
MRPRIEGTLEEVQDLLASNMGGQLQRGDTLGLWTYNEKLLAGKFPLQTWSPQNQKEIAARVNDFLKKQSFEKQADFSKVMPVLQGVIKDSDAITVIVVSSAQDNIQGTPFDQAINDYYRLSWSTQQDARMPVITVLQARQGRITDYTVGAAPGPIEIPKRTPEVVLTKTNASAPASPLPAPTAVTRVSRTAAQAQPAPIPPTASAAPTTAIVLKESVKTAGLASTNSASLKGEAKSEPSPAAGGSVTQMTAQAQKDTVSPPLSAAPMAALQESPKVVPDLTNSRTGSLGTTGGLKSEPTSTPGPASVTSTEVQVQGVAGSSIASAVVAALPENRKIADSPDRVAGGSSATAESEPSQANVPIFSTPAHREAAPVLSSAPPKTAALPENSEARELAGKDIDGKKPVASANLLVEVLTWGAELMVIIGAFGFGYLALRRSRPASRASLITHSMGQPGAPPGRRRNWA